MDTTTNPTPETPSARRERIAVAVFAATIAHAEKVIAGSYSEAEKELGLSKGEYDNDTHFPQLLVRKALQLTDALIAGLDGEGKS